MLNMNLYICTDSVALPILFMRKCFCLKSFFYIYKAISAYIYACIYIEMYRLVALHILFMMNLYLYNLYLYICIYMYPNIFI